MERFLALIGLLTIAHWAAFDLSVMTSDSMAPTLKGTSETNGDWVLSEKFTGWLRQPKRWEVLVLRDKEGTQIMKRVIGLPGETVALLEQQVVINGRGIERPKSLNFIKYFPYGNLAKGRTNECGEGYYVLGDASVDSQDSRYEGSFTKRQLQGRAWLRVWPLQRIGFVNP